MNGLHFPILALFPVFLLTADVNTVEFNKDVRPILSDKCFTCHGPDAAAKGIPFRLDSEAAAKADLGGHRAIVEGDPSSSTVVKRISAEKASSKMPPVNSGLKLSSAEVETIRAWIGQGAKWQKHWSFIPPVRKPLPAVRDKSWTKNPIDSFVLAELEKNGLKPSREAGRETLIRRVSLDLTGIPPTPDEIDAFLNDSSPSAYEKVVDRLLSSPRYGERMAARWLDAARYADTNGYQFDGERSMWRWRDWVIDAFNRNQPFDQFAIEQLAGDLLPHATLKQKIATGFNRNHRANSEDGIVAEEYAAEYVVDRVDTTSTVFLGLTLGCARCHNHKYDPFTQKEFYQLFAYFNNVPESGRAFKYGNSPPTIPAPTEEQQSALQSLVSKLESVEKSLNSRDRQIQSGQKKWESLLSTKTVEWWAPTRGLMAAFPLDKSDEGTPKDGTVRLVSGKIGGAAYFDGLSYLDAGAVGILEINDPFTLSAWLQPDQAADGSVVSRMVDSPKGKGYGLHLDHGKLHANLTGVFESDAIKVETLEPIEANRWNHVVLAYDGSVKADGVRIFVNGKSVKLKILQDNLYRPYNNANKKFNAPFRIGAGWGKDRRFKGSIDDVRMYRRRLSDDEISALASGQSLQVLAAKPEGSRSAPEQNALRWAYLERAAEAPIRDSWAQLGSLATEREALERTFPTVMIMAENPVVRKTNLLLRGAYDKPGPEVDRGVPEALHPLPPGAPKDRLGLAMWIVDPANPLTSRVAVNRFWQTYFGAGLVKTVEDFGVQGDWPSHPDLLDWLATEFLRTGWDIKAMQKLMVMSATYRQASEVTETLRQRDPENRLLARNSRQRLAPEIVRDQALAAAGLLVDKVGGRSVKPYQPEGLWTEQAMQDMEYVQGKGEDLYRRSLYTFWKRTIPPPMMMNFDAAGRETCVVRETRTNTPLQALNMMNDVTFVEAARFIGQRMLKQGGSEADGRLQYGFRLLTSRFARPEELKVLQESLRFHRDYFASDEKRIQAYLKAGESASDPALNRVDLAAYASVASLILNMDEVITRQ